jgi:hypothetical protein
MCAVCVVFKEKGLSFGEENIAHCLSLDGHLKIISLCALCLLKLPKTGLCLYYDQNYSFRPHVTENTAIFITKINNLVLFSDIIRTYNGIRTRHATEILVEKVHKNYDSANFIPSY